MVLFSLTEKPDWRSHSDQFVSPITLYTPRFSQFFHFIKQLFMLQTECVHCECKYPIIEVMIDFRSLEIVFADEIMAQLSNACNETELALIIFGI